MLGRGDKGSVVLEKKVVNECWNQGKHIMASREETEPKMLNRPRNKKKKKNISKQRAAAQRTLIQCGAANKSKKQIHSDV